MSNSERREFTALAELEQVLESVTESLASWRRRALEAEARATQAADGSPVGDIEALARIEDLRNENEDLKRRLGAAGNRVDALLKRLQFLEEQIAEGAEQQ